MRRRSAQLQIVFAFIEYPQSLQCGVIVVFGLRFECVSVGAFQKAHHHEFTHIWTGLRLPTMLLLAENTIQFRAPGSAE